MSKRYRIARLHRIIKQIEWERNKVKKEDVLSGNMITDFNWSIAYLKMVITMLENS
jgi:hypothetical protein